MMRHLAANALTILIVLGIVLAGVIGWGVSQFRGEGPHEAPVQVAIPRGADLATAAEILDEAGAISDPRIFRLGARYKELAGRIQAGEFEIPARSSMEDVLQCLVDQSTCARVEYPITLVEGDTAWQFVQQLREAEVLTGEIAGIPPEGTLAPDTYKVTRGMDRGELIGRMQAAQRRILEQAWAERDPDLPLESPEEALILASIIEKETGVADERRRVAAVFVNRLRRGMRLQTDPTVIYGITEGQGPLGRGLRRSELEAETPWNTYVITGLPPTPIANPGRASIEAAVNPAETDELYFVADGNGGHAFAETLSEHRRNVARWRRIEAERAETE
ncbi:MAG: endolytic transglycosylase MltG [Pseudomonadota bacterium]